MWWVVLVQIINYPPCPLNIFLPLKIQMEYTLLFQIFLDTFFLWLMGGSWIEKQKLKHLNFFLKFSHFKTQYNIMAPFVFSSWIGLCILCLSLLVWCAPRNISTIFRMWIIAAPTTNQNEYPRTASPSDVHVFFLSSIGNTLFRNLRWYWTPQVTKEPRLHATAKKNIKVVNFPNYLNYLTIKNIFIWF